MISKAIGLSKDAYLYLQERCRVERLGKSLSERGYNMLSQNFDRFQRDGYKDYKDGDCGGAENGRWTSWSVDQVMQMLDEKGLDYITGRTVEWMNL